MGFIPSVLFFVKITIILACIIRYYCNSHYICLVLYYSDVVAKAITLDMHGDVLTFTARAALQHYICLVLY